MDINMMARDLRCEAGHLIFARTNAYAVLAEVKYSYCPETRDTEASLVDLVVL